MVGGGSCGASANEYSCTGAQINFGDLTSYLAYDTDKLNRRIKDFRRIGTDAQITVAARTHTPPTFRDFAHNIGVKTPRFFCKDNTSFGAIDIFTKASVSNMITWTAVLYCRLWQTCKRVFTDTLLRLSTYENYGYRQLNIS